MWFSGEASSLPSTVNQSDSQNYKKQITDCSHLHVNLRYLVWAHPLKELQQKPVRWMLATNKWLVLRLETVMALDGLLGECTLTDPLVFGTLLHWFCLPLSLVQYLTPSRRTSQHLQGSFNVLSSAWQADKQAGAATNYILTSFCTSYPIYT